MFSLERKKGLAMVKTHLCPGFLDMTGFATFRGNIFCQFVAMRVPMAVRTLRRTEFELVDSRLLIASISGMAG